MWHDDLYTHSLAVCSCKLRSTDYCAGCTPACRFHAAGWASCWSMQNMIVRHACIRPVVGRRTTRLGSCKPQGCLMDVGVHLSGGLSKRIVSCCNTGGQKTSASEHETLYRSLQSSVVLPVLPCCQHLLPYLTNKILNQQTRHLQPPDRWSVGLCMLVFTSTQSLVILCYSRQ